MSPPGPTLDSHSTSTKTPLETDTTPCPYLPAGFSSVEQYLDELKLFLAQYKDISDLMIVDYFTTNSWETKMPIEWQKAFESNQGELSFEDLVTLVSYGVLRPFRQKTKGAKYSGRYPNLPTGKDQDWPESLQAFVKRVNDLSINRVVDPSYVRFKDTLDCHLTPGMSPKKVHEVEILSGLISSVAEEENIRSVIDLGAGQGYLSRVLAFQHQLRVLGVDSNTIQTCGAQTTQQKTEKIFEQKVRQAQQEQQRMDEEAALARSARAEGLCVGTTTTTNTSKSKSVAEKELPPQGEFHLQHITHHITSTTLPTLLKAHFPKKHGQSNGGTELADEDDEDERWTLCGLHACGDLTSTMIKLYLESSASCLFSVGCCYHWLTEKFDEDGKIILNDGSHGFPLSTVFNKRKVCLGDHPRMIACSSPQRWEKYQRESEDAIYGHYYRALLHKIMVDRSLFPGPPATAPVLGRMGKHRLKGFPHYVKTALKRLETKNILKPSPDATNAHTIIPDTPVSSSSPSLSSSVSSPLSTPSTKPCLKTAVANISIGSWTITDQEATAMYEKYLDQDLYRIGLFWSLRTMLGPLFEGLVLLDRWAYLQEHLDREALSSPSSKKGFVQLVAGFDIVESPRNMILIALKTAKN